MIRETAIVALSGLVFSITASADDIKPDATVGEMRRLDAFVGKWRVTLKGNSEAETTSHVEWILGGRFLRDEYRTQDGKQGLILRTYDETSKEYRVWTFTQDGSQYQVGKWNATDNELKVVGKRGEYKVVTIAKIKDKDTIEWAVGVTDSSGKIVEGYEGVNRRLPE